MAEFRTVTTVAEQQVARGIRYEVFVQEQKVPLPMEIDSRDDLPTTCQMVLYVDDEPVGTGRLLADPDDAERIHLGRLAIRKAWRGQGWGARLVEALERLAREKYSRETLICELSAQEYAVGFYENLGYRLMGRPRYLDAGIWHHDMDKPLRG
ncbi:MAG: GNAT family N-acetyltransferase [Bowdeniella nasicola]|nr:GNAT family N-acetyltransferase [Bowdeniella nasicola]